MENKIAEEIWRKKYSLEGEKNIEDSFKRIAKELAGIEKEEKRKEIEENSFSILKEFKFIPAGRILNAVGNPNNVAPFNCMVLPSPEDDIESIFEIAKMEARAFSKNYGVGIDLSNLRPAGSIVKNAAQFSDGVVSFMELYSDVVGVISQKGRRGALLLSISDTHPDLLLFIRSKRDNIEKIRYANISVRISNEFMEAVEKGKKWKLSFTTPYERIERVKEAGEIFEEITESAWKSAEPGVLLWTNMMDYMPSAQYDEFRALTTNPCGERALPGGGVCNLGSINLLAFVKEWFGDFDFEDFRKTVKYAVRFLDNVIDYAFIKNVFMFDITKEKLKASRPIGLGILGLADALAKMGIKYDSEEALETVDRIMEEMKIAAYEASIELAKEKGAFPAFNPEIHLKSKFFDEFPLELKEKIKQYGLRNIELLSIAPTGSISFIAAYKMKGMGATSTGIEPIFQLNYKRRFESIRGIEEIEARHPLYEEFRNSNLFKDERIEEKIAKKIFRTAYDIDWEWRILMQSVIQKHIDASISSTINLPKRTHLETIKRIYKEAWKRGLKGVTIYRDASRVNILEAKVEKDYEEVRKEKKHKVIILNMEEIEKLSKKDIGKCPVCGSPLVKEGGCTSCPACGWSKCDV